MSNFEIVEKACWAFDHGKADAGELNELFDYLAKEAFPNDHDWRSKAMNTRWGQDLILKSAGGHLRKMQMQGGHNEDAIRKLSHHDETGGSSGGRVRDDNAPRNRRNQSHDNMNPPESTPDNGKHEPSYDAQKLSLAMKEDLLDYVQANPKVKYDDAVAHIYGKWNRAEQAYKEASTRFANMKGARHART